MSCLLGVQRCEVDPGTFQVRKVGMSVVGLSAPELSGRRQFKGGSCGSGLADGLVDGLNHPEHDDCRIEATEATSALAGEVRMSVNMEGHDWLVDSDSMC